MISVILPSRGRPASLVKSTTSVFELAARPDQIEVLVAADPDDPGTHAVAEDLGADCWVAPERFGYGRLQMYFNALAEIAVGDWVFPFNDDALMTTQGWDVRIEELPADVFVADLHNAFSPGLNCFPAIRREAIRALGGFVTAETPHIDSWWQEISRRSDTARTVDVHVHHDRFDLTGGHNDATYHEGRLGLRNAEFFGTVIQSQIDTAAATIAELAATRRQA